MRYYVSVFGESFAPLSKHAGASLVAKCSQNLRRFRIETGLDYRGFHVAGAEIAGSPDITMASVRQNLSTLDPKVPFGSVRVVLSATPLESDPGEPVSQLVLGVTEGPAQAWTSGRGAYYANLSVEAGNLWQRDAAIVDIFQDIMIANSPAIQAVLANFLHAGKTMADFYISKANFAKSNIASFGGRFDQYAPDEYACFSSLVRRSTYAALPSSQLKNLGTAWARFLQDNLSDYFCDPEHAVRIVTNTGSHNIANGKSSKFGNIAADDLLDLFTDRQSVNVSGLYFLCVRTKMPKQNENVLEAFFHRKSKGRLKRLRLIPAASYHSVSALVRTGFVTPVGLFLKV